MDKSGRRVILCRFFYLFDAQNLMYNLNNSPLLFFNNYTSNRFQCYCII